MGTKFIKKVDAELFNKTKKEWKEQIDQNPGNVSDVYYEAGLDYCERTIGDKVEVGDGAGCVCAVVKADDSTLALILVSHAKSHSTSPNLKMLSMYVQPALNLADREPNYPALAWIAARAIVGCLRMTYETYPSDQLKIHTDFPLDKEFLTAVTTAVFDQYGFSEHYEVTSHGNWLVVTKKGKPVSPRLEIVA